MSQVTYAWNPFQERVDCRIPNEVIKTTAQNNRMEFVPRGAPFFSRNFQLFVQGSGTPLTLGVDYVFGHTFDRFITTYSRNTFGSVVLLRPFPNQALVAHYDTIGGPFVLDQVAFNELVANIVNAPRTAVWENLVNVPTEFPSDPHDHPAAQTYDYQEMMTALRSLILAVTNTNQDVTLKAIVEEHLNKPLIQAHQAAKSDFGLDDTPNMKAATNADLAGSSANLLITVATLKEALRRFAAGTLNL